MRWTSSGVGSVGLCWWWVQGGHGLSQHMQCVLLMSAQLGVARPSLGSPSLQLCLFSRWSLILWHITGQLAGSCEFVCSAFHEQLNQCQHNIESFPRPHMPPILCRSLPTTGNKLGPIAKLGHARSVWQHVSLSVPYNMLVHPSCLRAMGHCENSFLCGCLRSLLLEDTRHCTGLLVVGCDESPPRPVTAAAVVVTLYPQHFLFTFTCFPLPAT